MTMMRMIGRALSSVRPGVDALTGETLGRSVPPSIVVTSPAFSESEAIPRSFTAQGDGRFPGVAWSGLPEGTRSVVLLVEDADIPFAVPVTHLIVHSIDPAIGGIAADGIGAFMPGASREGWACGRNFLGAAGWTPPAPPPGHGPHRYAFQVFALRAAPWFRHPPHRGRLMRTVRPYLLARGRLIGTYVNVR